MSVCIKSMKIKISKSVCDNLYRLAMSYDLVGGIFVQLRPFVCYSLVACSLSQPSNVLRDTGLFSVAVTS